MFYLLLQLFYDFIGEAFFVAGAFFLQAGGFFGFFLPLLFQFLEMEDFLLNKTGEIHTGMKSHHITVFKGGFFQMDPSYM